MIIDTAVRVIRYVELDAAGVPLCENTVYLFTGTEEEPFAALVAAAAKKGHTIVRLCNHDDGCTTPDLAHIESDGVGGIRAKGAHPDALAGVEVWDAARHERAFLPVDILDDEGAVVATQIVRFEPGEWTPQTKAARLVFGAAGLVTEEAQQPA